MSEIPFLILKATKGIFTSWNLDKTVVYIRESTKPILCSKWGHFDKAKSILKILLAFWTFYTIEKGLDL